MFEKEAEKILNNHCDCELLSECLEGIRIRCSDFEEKKKLLIEGIEFGYNKANEWHDLRKNPNDLPNTDRNVWVKRESEIECQIDNYYEDDKGWGIMFREGYCTDDVILWCELPVPPKESE